MLAITKIKKDIEFNKNLKSMLEILKTVSASQFHILEKKLKLFEVFENVLKDFFRLFDLTTLRHPFIVPDPNSSLGVVAVTSDQGLLGGLNLRIINMAFGLMKSERDELIIVGERGHIFARGQQIPFTSFPGIRDDQKDAQAEALRNYLFKKAVSGSYGTLKVVYPSATTLATQRVEIATFLPFSQPEKNQPSIDLSQTILETPPEKMLEYLVFLLIGHRLKEIFGLSRLAELGARYMHLEDSSQKIQELNQKLRLRYFRLRHESIDQSMRELFAARSLYAA